eukprot:m.16601 g.16601  ORF g.16601 m.16601 type:complete len:99 (+) comp27031_c0_seq2:31-327(+)
MTSSYSPFYYMANEEVFHNCLFLYCWLQDPNLCLTWKQTNKTAKHASNGQLDLHTCSANKAYQLLNLQGRGERYTDLESGACTEKVYQSTPGACTFSM